MDLNPIESLAYFAPELTLGIAIIGLILADLVVRDKRRLGELSAVAVALSCLFVAFLADDSDAYLFNRMIVQDQFAVFFKVLFALATIAAIWMSLGSREVERISQGEYYALLLSSALGMYFMAGANNLLMAYLSLEFVSLTSYVLTGTMRHDRRSGEASLKYLIYGGVASGTMIYGMSWIFGIAGTMDYAGINAALAASESNAVVLYIAILLTLAGFGYKIAAVPFHMWAPDVYHGAPIPITAFLSVASKAAGFALLLRFFYPALSKLGANGQWELLGGANWPQLMIGVSMATMTLGNLAAIQQTNLKRLLAYSSIAHAGYLLMGMVVLSDEGLRAVLFYLMAYYLMNIGAFLIVMVVANSTGREDFEGFRGLAWRGGALPAVAMAVFLFSLAGIPPFGGFIGKFYLFAAVIRAEYYGLALVGALNSVVSLYYYARIIRTMFLDQPQGGEATVTLGRFYGLLAGGLAVATLVLGVYWIPFIEFAGRSAHFFRG
jgi:NADH-quinone oxidoreductase subunit N